MAISKRIFGSDIPLKVKQKLALRQELNKTSDFGEAVKNVTDQYVEPSNYARKKSSELSKYDKQADEWLTKEISNTKERLEDVPYRESDEYLKLLNLFHQSYE